MGINRAIVARLDEQRVTTVLEGARMRIVNRIFRPRFATVPVRPPLSSSLTITLEEISGLLHPSGGSHLSDRQFISHLGEKPGEKPGPPFVRSPNRQITTECESMTYGVFRYVHRIILCTADSQKNRAYILLTRIGRSFSQLTQRSPDVPMAPEDVPCRDCHASSCLSHMRWGSITASTAVSAGRCSAAGIRSPSAPMGTANAGFSSD